jgi:hypothetical protein
VSCRQAGRSYRRPLSTSGRMPRHKFDGSDPRDLLERGAGRTTAAGEGIRQRGMAIATGARVGAWRPGRGSRARDGDAVMTAQWQVGARSPRRDRQLVKGAVDASTNSVALSAGPAAARRMPASAASRPGASRMPWASVCLWPRLSDRFFPWREPQAPKGVKLSGNFLIASVIEALGGAVALVGRRGSIEANLSIPQHPRCLPHRFIEPMRAYRRGKSSFRRIFPVPLGHKEITLVAAEGVRAPVGAREPAARPALEAFAPPWRRIRRVSEGTARRRGRRRPLKGRASSAADRRRRLARAARLLRSRGGRH